MNVLIDTNVLLSAALRDRLPESVVLYVASRDDVRCSIIVAETNFLEAKPWAKSLLNCRNIRSKR